MEITIKSLNCETLDDIVKADGVRWFYDTFRFFEDGVEVCDVSLNLDNVKVELDTDGVWLTVFGGGVWKVNREDFLEIIIF